MNIGSIGTALPPISPQAGAQQQDAPPSGLSKEALAAGGAKEASASARELRGNPRGAPVGSKENAGQPENEKVGGQQQSPLEELQAAQRQTPAEQAEEEAKAGEQGGKGQQDALESSIDALKEFVKPFNTSLDFSIDEDTGKTVVKVVDKESGDTIRQIPSEEMLAISKAIDKIKGLLLKQTA
jgi:flagellar protein FlaG